MKGLWKHLTPFAPDQSGAASVLYELGGIIVVVDAGGCTGNICGFDEPRWFGTRSAIFSAGLRDMDAIMGSDERLVKNIVRAAERIDASFVALVGTPVPAVIGTDLSALARMVEKRCGIAAFAVETTGTGYYDDGASRAYRALIDRFAVGELPVEEGHVGVLGVTPLDFGSPDARFELEQKLFDEGARRVSSFGLGVVGEMFFASAAEKNVVVAPSGLAAARALQERFGTPYVCNDPLAEGLALRDVRCERALVVHQQVRANGVRYALEERGACEVTAATWFTLDDELARPGDVRLGSEDDFAQLVAAGGYDLIVADAELRAICPGCSARWVDLPHFALSGRLEKPWPMS